MPDQNIKIIVGGQNDSRQTFDQVKRDLADVRKEAEKPVQFGPVKPPRFDEITREARDRQAGQTRGLRDRGDAAEHAARLRRATGLDDLSAGDLIREQNDRFRATRGAGSDGTGGNKIPELPRGIKERYGEVAGKLVALHGIMKVAEAGVEALDVAFAKPNTKRAAEGYLKLSEAIGKIPVVGGFALSVANKLSGGALEAAKKALDDADAIDKQTAELGAKMIARRARGEQIVSGTRSGAREASNTLRLAGTEGDERARLQIHQEYLDKTADLDKQYQQRFDRDLSPAQRLELEKNVGIQRVAAEHKLRDDLAAIGVAANQAESQRNQQHADTIIDQRNRAAADELRIAGFTQQAALAQIEADFNAKKEELATKLNAEQQGQKPGSFAYESADTRFNDDLAVAQAARDRKIAEQNKNDDLDRANQARDVEHKIVDIRTQAAAERIRISGDGFKADQLLRAAALKREIEDINKNFDEQARLHADRIPELTAQRDALIAAAQDKSQADDDAAQKAEAAKFKVKGPAPFSGESRLLTGVGSSTDPLLEPTAKTARNSDKRIIQGDALQGTMNQILTAIQSGASGVLLAGPV